MGNGVGMLGAGSPSHGRVHPLRRGQTAVARGRRGGMSGAVRVEDTVERRAVMQAIVEGIRALARAYGVARLER